MFNVAIIRFKDIIRFLFLIFGIIIIIVFSKKYIKYKPTNTLDLNNYMTKSLEIQLPEIPKSENHDEVEKAENNKFFTKILSIGLNVINANKNIIEDNKNLEKEENIKTEEEKLELAKENLKTEVITKNPLIDKYTKKYKGVKIKNETSYDLTDEDLNYDNLKIDKSNIIIFHTHTCESYTSSEKYTYTPTGNFRTTDKKYSIVKVGDKLTNYLQKYNLNVVHNTTYHDYPAYTGSYSRSASTVSNILKTTKADIIIDLHRDAIGSNSSYAPIVKIGDEICAQLMFVMGSNGGGLNHPNWKTNLKFAVKLQEMANKKYPGLFKTIILRNSRYNQNLGKAACIIEVGSTGNTLDQCLNSMKYLAEIINQFN